MRIIITIAVAAALLGACADQRDTFAKGIFEQLDRQAGGVGEGQ